MKRTSLIGLTIVLSFFAFTTIALADFFGSHVAFIFTSTGQYVEKTESLPKGKDTLTVNSLSGTSSSVLGLSLSKVTLFGNSYISRCNKSISSTVTVKCSWTQNAGTYVGTVVLDTKDPLISKIDGEMYLSTIV